MGEAPALERRILIVDDEEPIRSVERRVLCRTGFGIAEAGTRADAIAMLASIHPALLLCDLSLPDGSGLDVVDRTRELYPGTPVLVVSGYGVNRVARDDVSFLQKPYEIAELRAAVTALLENVPGALH